MPSEPDPRADVEGRTPPEPEPETEGGDPACWLHRVCPSCGRLADEDPPTICPACGERIDVV